MNAIDAFLTISGLAYFLCLPFRCTNNLSTIAEKLSFILCGSLILSSLYLLPNRYFHFALSIFYVFASLMSWLGKNKWRFNESDDISPIHQIAMFFWDLLIALCFMTKF